MKSFLASFLSGLREFLSTLHGLWIINQKVLANQKKPPLQFSYDFKEQAKRRLFLQAASGATYARSLSRSSSKAELLSASWDQSCHTSKDSLGSGDSLPTKSSPSEGIFNLLAILWMTNSGLVLILWVIFQLSSLIYLRFIVWWLPISLKTNVITWAVSNVAQICILFVMEIFNVIYLKRIYEKISVILPFRVTKRISTHSKTRYSEIDKLRSRQTWTSVENLSQRKPISIFGVSEAIDNQIVSKVSGYGLSYGIGNFIIDRAYTFLFFIFYDLQWRVISSITWLSWLRFLIEVCSLSFVYGCYAFEYHSRRTPGITFDILMSRIIKHWSFLMGYGLPIGLPLTILSQVIGPGGIFMALAYPVLMVGAFHVDWEKALNDENHACHLTQFFLLLSMRPALFVNNIVINLFIWIGRRVWLSRARHIHQHHTFHSSNPNSILSSKYRP